MVADATRPYLVLGAKGALASELLGVLGCLCTGLSRAELDITDAGAVRRCFDARRPTWVINPCAFHRVEDCEDDPGRSFAVNAVGAATVAREAARIGAGVAFISTDYVFGGESRERGRPYTELDAPAPRNTYGTSKLAGEQLVQQRNTRHLILRTASLYGTHTSGKGWTFPESMLRRARAGESLRVVSDQVMSPSSTVDVARTIALLLANDATGTYHLTNDGECSWYEFACEVLAMAQVPAALEPVTTTDVPGRARRPRYSALSSVRLADAGIPLRRPWRDALGDFIRSRDDA